MNKFKVGDTVWWFQSDEIDGFPLLPEQIKLYCGIIEEIFNEDQIWVNNLCVDTASKYLYVTKEDAIDNMINYLLRILHD